MPEPIAEKVLLYRLKTKQDPEAFAALYDKYVQRIYRFVYFKVGSQAEAEDVTSEVWLKAWNYVQEQREIGSFSGLLYRIARNAIIDLYRKKAARPGEATALGEAGLELSDGGRWYADVSARADTERIVEFLKKLKHEYREVITLRYIDELSVEEIAAIMGKGQLAVRVTLHRALKRLRGLLSAEEG